MRRALMFASLTISITLAAALALSLIFRTPAEHRAIALSAIVAIIVQIGGFGIASLAVPANPIAGWGAVVLLRFLTVVVYGLLAVRAIGLPPAAALISIASFLFLTTLIEPFFLHPMKTGKLALSLLLLAAPVAARPAHAQEHGAARLDSAVSPAKELIQQSTGEHGEAAHPAAPADIIMPHITDAKHFEIPWPNSHLAKEIHLPTWNVAVGPLTIDLAPTKHILMMLIAATLCCLVLITGAQAQARRHTEHGKPPKGIANAVEAIVLYMRNEVILPNVGHHGQGYVPFALTLFFFILFMNLLGLVPYGSTATGNISVTATLAIITFVMIEVAGMKALGKGYINTIIYWPHDMSLAMKLPLTIILTPVELIGKITKPFALAIRLFANMTAGHVIVLALIGLIFTFPLYVFPAPLIMAIAIMLLELMVSFIQAFIFTLLASVFIGLIRESAH